MYRTVKKHITFQYGITKRIATLLFICVFVFVPESKARNQRLFIDAFAATVNGNVILESDIRFESGFIRFESGISGQHTGKNDRDDVLEMLVNRELLLIEARRFVTRVITEKEIQERISELDSKYGGLENRMAFLSDTGLDEAFWRTRVRNDLLLEHYYDQRLRPFLRVTREMEDQYIIDNASSLGLQRVTDPEHDLPQNHPARTIAYERISKQLMHEKVEQLLQDLRATAVVVHALSKHSNSDVSDDNSR